VTLSFVTTSRHGQHLPRRISAPANICKGCPLRQAMATFLPPPTAQRAISA
jgi:hypothetical protein